MRQETQTSKRAPNTLARIAAMNPAELTERFRQELQKRVDAILFGLGIAPSLTNFRDSPPQSPRFFFDSEDLPRYVSLMRERLPQQTESILQSADKICQHRFNLLGYEDLYYGPEIDWHLDLVHGKRAPCDLWFKIRYLDFASVGDAKVIWELSRHQHLVVLAKAYRLTGDFRFASELISQWRHWQKANPYPRGINWASCLEVAIRSLSWLWAYFLLKGTPAMTHEFHEEWLRAIALNARHIELYLSTYFSPNTHLLGEAVALFFSGTLCPSLRSSARWTRRGWEIILRESERQVRSDGFYFEQSTYYHVYALDFFLHASVLASLNGMPFPAEYNHRLARMLEALAVLCRAGPPPRWGDDDGGRLFDPLRNRAEHLSDPLASGAILFGRGDFKWLAGELREETLWLFGEKGVAEFDRIRDKEPEMCSVSLPESGLFVMSCSEQKLQAVIDAGPQGGLAAGHGHADALSLTLHAGGRELIGDPGTYAYVGSGTERDRYRSTAAHNTIELDGCSQSIPSGPFAWDRFTIASGEHWVSGHTFDFFVGSHGGYSSAEHAILHRRWIFFRKPKFLLIRDLLLGTGEHQVDLRWHLHPALAAPAGGEGPFTLPGGTAGIALFSAAERSWPKTVSQGGWSAAYGVQQQATVVRFTNVTTLPTECATVLDPFGNLPKEAATPARFKRLPPSPGVSAYCFTENGEEHCFLFGLANFWAFAQWKSDAEFLYCCRSSGKLHLLVLCHGTYVEFCGVRIVSSRKRLSRCEILCAGGNIQVLSPEDDILVPEKEFRRTVDAEQKFIQESS